MRTPSSSLLVLLCLTLALGAWPRAVHAQAAEQVQYYHTDAIGSVRMITDAAGNVMARYDYLPFGQPWPSDQDPEPRRFAGYERELTTGSGSWEALDYAGARYYSSQTGRFMSVDPVLLLERGIADPQTWNRYPYVRNNPLRYVDPDGRIIWPVLVVAFGAAVLTPSGEGSDDYGRMILNATAAGLGLGGIIKLWGERKGDTTKEVEVGQHITDQMGSRGWTRDAIDDAIQSPTRTVATRDTRHLPGGGQMDDPATAYYSKDGGYVVRNDRTGDIVQISNRNNANWKAPWD